MLKILKVRNYKSLKEVDIKLGKFNALIGLNASGKSNIIDCLAFLSESLQTYYDLTPILEKGGDSSTWYFREREKLY